MSTNILNGSDEFPYPISINRLEFQNFNENEIDKFLFDNHRFSSIDSLIKELNNLSIELNQELLRLINNEYNDFIKLGKSINGGLDLINVIKMDLKNFKNDLGAAKESFNYSSDMIESTLKKKEHLMKLKMIIKLCLLLDNQILNFENLLKLDMTETNIKLKNLTTLYLSILKLFNFINSEAADNGNNHFVNKHLVTKISSLKFEFKSYLDDLLVHSNRNRLDNKLVLIDLLSIYKIIGHESDFLSIIKNSK